MTRASHFPPLHMWLLSLALTCFASQLNASAQETGRPFLRNFPLREYHAHNQNWAAVQDAQGVMYFGNKAVVLEYDGVSWRKIPVGQTTYVRGLALDSASGKIYVGGVDELGYLEPGPDGEKVFVSLLAQLPAEAHGFRDIRRVYVTPEGILFVAEQQVMRWREGAFQVWKLPNASRLQSFMIGGQLLVHHRDFGLLRLENGEFTPAALDPIFRSVELTMLIAESDGSALIGTRENGLFKFNGGVVSPLATEVDSFLRDKKITRGLRLTDGSLALATASSGVVILDRELRLRGRIDETSELQNNIVLDLFLDREAGLWLCLNSGIARVEAASALSIFDAATGLGRTTARDILRFRGTLFAATGHGLFRLLPAAPAEARAARFERAADIETDFWSLCAHDRGLLAAGGAGVFQLGDDGAKTVLPSSVPLQVLHRSTVHPDRVFVGGRNGLRSIRFDARSDRWLDEGAIAGADHEVRTIVEDSRGELWLGTPTNGIYRVTFAGSTDTSRGSANVLRFLSTHGLPPGQQWTRVAKSARSDVIFATQAGLYRFDRNTGQFIPAVEYGARFTDGSFMLGNVAEGADQHLWLAGRTSDGIWVDQELGRALTSGDAAGGFQPLPYKIADRIGEIEKFYPEHEPMGGDIVWIGGTDGIVRVEVARLPAAGEQGGFTTVIRRALTAMRDGSTRPQSAPGGVLPYDQNTVRFEFATDTFAIGSGVRYQTRLQGFEDGHWSDFYDYTGVDYTNLPEGDYVFEVRARDIDGRLGSVASFPFRIEPPWHRTPWAYALYALVAVAAIFGIVRWQLRRSHSKNAQLESLVTARTRELREREIELVRAKEGADAANRAKSVFLANMSHELRTPLNAILGYTQILLKDEELSEKNRERLSVVGQSGTHLLTLINEVLDLAKIEAGKLTLNPAPFAFDRLLADTCLAFRQPVQEKGLEFSCTFAPGLPAVINTDAGKLRQVLFNLLSNALKFTQRGRVVFKVTETAEGMIRFEVIDTGVGMGAEDLRDIFQAFHQAGRTGPAAEGTGLGLTISRHLVELLGGKLNVESALGHGSRFWFELMPVGATGSVALAETGKPARVAGFAGARRRLLLTDDEPTNRTVLRELLEPLGFDVEEASDGEQCLEMCQRNAPDAVLLDLRMGAVDGFEVARTLRSRHGAQLKIIAITASVFESDRQQALDAGCDDFLPKPFTEEQLLSTLGRVLALEWHYAAEKAQTLSACVNGTEPVAPPAEEIDAVLELSRRGDILGIKKRLATLAAVDQGRYAPFVGILEPFVAAYQMNRIRDTMLKFKENGNHHP